MKAILKHLDQKLRSWNHRRIDFFRYLKIQLFLRIFNSCSKFTELSDKRSILVLRLDNKIGDSLTSTGFLRELKKNNPNSRLIVLAGPQSFQIYKNLKYIDEVHIIYKSFKSILSHYLALKKTNYKYIINTSHLLTPGVIFLCSQLTSMKKLTFLNTRAKLFNLHVNYHENTDHITVRYKKTLDLLEGSSREYDLSYDLVIDPKDLNLARERILELRKKYKKIIIFNSFSGARRRNLNQKKTTEIIGQITKDEGVAVISIASKNDLHTVIDWQEQAQIKNWFSFGDLSDFYFNCGLIKWADLVITPDTSIVHIASAYKKKLIGLYCEDSVEGEKNSLIWAPFETDFLVLRAPIKNEETDTINLISSEEVANTAKEMLKN